MSCWNCDSKSAPVIVAPVTLARNGDKGCDICQASPHVGHGDCAGPIGLSGEVAGALLEQDDDESETEPVSADQDIVTSKAN